MRPRQDLATIFATFLRLEANQISTWQYEPRLKRNLQRLFAQEPAANAMSATAMAIYWHHQHQPLATNLPRLHLFAYIQEPCYWAAHRLSQRLTSSSSIALYTIGDCFQIAIVDFPKILIKFDSSRGASLATYAEFAFSSVIRDTLKQRRELEICSDWSLLRKSSKKRLIEALENHGLPAAQIQHYSLAWLCFRELWVPEAQEQRSSSPPPQIWNDLAQAYRQVKPLEQSEASPAQLEQWLQQSGKILRSYLYPQASSLNEMLPGMEGHEKLDRLTSDDDSPLGQLIDQDDLRSRQQQQVQVQQVLQQAIQSLKPDWQRILQAYYQQNQNQTQIAKAMNCSQPSIARHLVKARSALLSALVNWAETELNNIPNPDRIGDHSEALEEWLQLYYGRIAKPSRS